MSAHWRTIRNAVRTGWLIAADPTAATIGAGELPPLAADIGLRADATVVVPAHGQVVFRLLGRSAARVFDFQSAHDRDRPARPGQDFLDYVGLSTFGSEEAAIRTARRFPKIIARVHLPAGEGLMLARTLPDAAQHYTVWGDPQVLLGRVVHITRIDGPG
jgi:hypothetical protein